MDEAFFCKLYYLLKEQVIKDDLLVDILAVFVSTYAVRRNHHQLNGMCLGVLLAVLKRVNLAAKFCLIAFVDSVFVLTELHLTEIVCPLTFPF